MRLNDLYPAAIIIIMIGIVLGVGLYTLNQVGDELANTLGTVTNETGLFINNSGATVDQATADGFNTFALTSCFGNATGAGLVTTANLSIASGNWTTVADTGVITNATATTYDDVKCSYTYYYGTDASAAVDNTVTGLGEFGGWISVIVVVMAAAIVLGIVLRSFGRQPGV